MYNISTIDYNRTTNSEHKLFKGMLLNLEFPFSINISDPLGAGDDFLNANVLFYEFIIGLKKSPDTDHKTRLANMTKILKDFYQWNETIPFLKISSQNCSEMIIFLGKPT